MGACYSKSGHELDTTKPEKRPKDRKKGSQKNGHAGSNHKPRLIVEDFDSIQKDVSDTVYTEDSHTINGLDVDNLLHKSQQTSLDTLARDASRNSEVPTTCDSSETGDKDGIHDQIGNCDVKHEPQTAETRTDIDNDLVVISDSGIVIDTCTNSEQNDPEQNVKDSKNIAKHNFEDSHKVESSLTLTNTSVIKNSEVSSDHTETKNGDKENLNCLDLNSSENDSTPVQGKSQTEHSSNYHHGECQGHLFRSLKQMSHVNGSSETLLKSSLRKGKGRPRKKKGLSWKSSDSLDYVESMATSLDRTKSVCSSILGDDISLIHAPLATFDSTDFVIGDSYDFSKLCDLKIKESHSNGCDEFSSPGKISNRFVRQSVGSIDELSDSYITCDSPSKTDSCNLSDSYTCLNAHTHTDSTSDLDKLKLAVRQTTNSTSADQWSLSDSLDAGFELSDQSQPIRAMKIDGRDVVVMDQDVFSQIIDEIQFLKAELSQLTEVIKETDPLSQGMAEGTSISST